MPGTKALLKGNILVALPSYSLPPLTYHTNIEIPLGSFVQVSLRNKSLVGIAIGISDYEGKKDKIKQVDKVLDSSISKDFLEFLDYFSKYNLVDYGSMTKMVIPSQDFFLEDKARIKKLENTMEASFPVLSNDQKIAAEKLLGAKPGFEVTLLEGITGSGKTEVFFAKVRQILHDTDKQVLILLPEIALTNQIIDRAHKALGVPPTIWHSSVTKARKKQNWLDIVSGKARLVIGARSALLLPFKELGLIVIDEEHDGSYKQEEQGIYSARDMAIMRAKYSKFPLILASATPSLETINNVLQGKFQHITLKNRYGEAVLPDIEIIDMRKENKKYFLSSILVKEIKKTLENKQQIMLFINRRGYAPLKICKPCGYRFSCRKCHVFMVEHKATNKLLCHYCGYKIDAPKSCPKCEDSDFVPFGVGVERIDEEVKSIFPNAKTLVVTSDTVSTEKKLKEAITSITDHQVDIVIGTQILAKGHNFPGLTLVAIIDGDFGLGGADLRASERSYQLLTQVGGRAGRYKEKGKVFIQSYDPDNELIKALQEKDAKRFIESELKEREEAFLPPFAKLAGVLISSHKEELAAKLAHEIVRVSPSSEVEILGPAPSMIFKVNHQYRYRILYKSSKKINLSKFVDNIVKSVKIPNSVKVKIDIDPYSFV